MAAEYLDLKEEERDRLAWFFGNQIWTTMAVNCDPKKMPQLKHVIDNLRGKKWTTIKSKEDLEKWQAEHGTRCAGRNHNAV
jgi:hypothetical protein